MNEPVQLAFDYSALPQGPASKAWAAAERIKLRLRRTAEDIVEIGRELVEVKAVLQHGMFLAWVEKEFEMSDNTANRFMQVAKRFGQIPQIGGFKPSVLYLLAEKSTPEAVVDQATAKAESGEKVSVEDVKRWKAEADARIASEARPRRNSRG